MRILYLSYDGLLDPLGQSQILPYLEALSGPHIKIDIVSFEKSYRWNQGKTVASKNLRCRLNNKAIDWYPKPYTKSPPILSSLWDLWILKKAVKKLQNEARYDIVHCRSYFPSLVGLWAKRTFGVSFVFDMRGFWADEKVDGGIWSRNRWPYSWIYRYFKFKEKQFFKEADAVVCLTNRAAKIIQSWNLKPVPLPITVIPCCVDLDFFHQRSIKEEETKNWEKKLNLTKEDFVVLFLGSLVWYHLEEMLEFFSILLKKIPSAKFLFVSNDPPKNFSNLVQRYKIPEESVRFTFTARDQIPNLISLARVGLFFGQTTFSRTASSATKMPELLAMGVPVVTNANVGDTDEILARHSVGKLVKSFSKVEYSLVIDQLEKFVLQSNKADVRKAAELEFSLSMGVSRYRKIYADILSQRL